MIEAVEVVGPEVLLAGSRALANLLDNAPSSAKSLSDLIGWLEAGAIRAPGVTTFPLTEVGEAHRAIESGQTTGKLILLP